MGAGIAIIVIEYCVRELLLLIGGNAVAIVFHGCLSWLSSIVIAEAIEKKGTH